MTVYQQKDDCDVIVLENGEQIDLQCCECGLTHRIEARVDGPRVSLRFRRNEGATKRARKKQAKVR